MKSVNILQTLVELAIIAFSVWFLAKWIYPFMQLFGDLGPEVGSGGSVVVLANYLFLIAVATDIIFYLLLRKFASYNIKVAVGLSILLLAITGFISVLIYHFWILFLPPIIVFFVRYLLLKLKS